jgi:Putative  PD-(D/E)XK family member, (DUF4420)
VFLAVGHLSVSLAVIQQYLVSDSWRTRDGQEFSAYRILVPGESHFIGVVALIVEELLRHGFESDPQSAFARSEPLIELALERAGVGDDAALGLLGELIVLEQALVLNPAPAMRQRVLDAWTGYRRAARDFAGLGTALEVKTTRLNRSRHHISNIDQVTPVPRNGPAVVERLFLVSIGVQAAVNTKGRSVASQVAHLCTLLVRELDATDAERLSGAFLQCVRLYGATSNQFEGYDHKLMHNWPKFTREWEIRFLRVYDMADDLIQVIRRDDLDQYRHVCDGSMHYEIDLPDVVRGDINPVSNSDRAIKLLFGLTE